MLLAEIYSIAQKIALFHTRAHTARRRYHQIGLLVKNVRRRLYNHSECVKDRIRIMERSHVKYNGSACE